MVINIQYLLYVDRLMPRFPCLFRGKYLLENAGNGISECLGFKIFWGNMPPDPLTLRRLRRNNFSSRRA